jgi:major type 1 subunit fimbrin (pilin)
MKNTNIAKYSIGAGLVAAAVLSISPSAFAASVESGTVTFTGSLTASTCTISALTQNQTVTLPTLPITQFSNTPVGSFAGAKSFSFTLTGCGTATKATASFDVSPQLDTTTGALINTGTATGIEVQLVNDPDLTAITIGAQTSYAESAAITSGAATLNYAARYYQSATSVSAGSVSTSVQYSMSYQ